MKSCPYCSEEIQAEAIKCKHCGEWLNKTRASDVINKISSFFKSGANNIEGQKRKIEEKRWSHLYEPTAQTPFSYNDNDLFLSHLQVGLTRIELDEIFGIIFHSSSKSINGVTSSTSITFKICYSPGDRVSLYPEKYKEHTITNGTYVPLANRKDIERLQFMFQLLQKMTVKYRLIRYTNAVKKNGYFNYLDSAEIFNNGDLKHKSGKTVNIKTAYQSGLISLGSKFSGLRSASYDPFAFVIYPSTGIKVKVLGFELNSKIEIQTIYNKDCFETIIEKIITTGQIVP